VLGIGFAATRDLTAFLRHAAADDAGTANPAAGLVRWTVATGTSQSGNFLKSFLNLGFNADEQGRVVFDGMNPNIAARQLPMNIRFGVPGGAANLFEPGSEGVLWWGDHDDSTRGRGVTSLLDRCKKDRTCPKIVETFGSTELWGLRLSPELVGTDAKADVPIPANVRRYYFPSVTHGGSYVGGISLDGDKPWPGAPTCLLPGNPNPSLPTMRALLKALVAWVKTGKAPPPSRYPTIAAGDLVAANAKAMGWPDIPGAPKPDGLLNEFFDYDVGPNFDYPDLSGIATIQPPRIRRTIPSLVPRVNADGNETAGVRLPDIAAPLGTYTGWNVYKTPFPEGELCDRDGSFLAFAKTKAERVAKSDPRPSLEELYGDHAGYVKKIEAAATALVRQRLLLQEDAERYIERARRNDPFKS